MKIFLKNRDYFLMSMSCFFKVENDTTELKQCPTIEKHVNLQRDLLKMELPWI